MSGLGFGKRAQKGSTMETLLSVLMFLPVAIAAVLVAMASALALAGAVTDTELAFRGELIVWEGAYLPRVSRETGGRVFHVKRPLPPRDARGRFVKRAPSRPPAHTWIRCRGWRPPAPTQGAG